MRFDRKTMAYFLPVTWKENIVYRIKCEVRSIYEFTHKSRYVAGVAVERDIFPVKIFRRFQLDHEEIGHQATIPENKIEVRVLDLIWLTWAVKSIYLPMAFFLKSLIR